MRTKFTFVIVFFLTRLFTCPLLLRVRVLLYLQWLTSLKYSFLGAFIKLRSGVISFLISLRAGQIITKLDIFFYFENFILLKSDKYIGYFTCRPMHIYDSVSLNYS